MTKTHEYILNDMRARYDPVKRREKYLRTKEQTLYVNSLWRKKNKEKTTEYFRNAVHFKGTTIFLDHNPRKGVCDSCGSEGYTQIHHDQYDPTNVMKYTRELCPGCHTGLRYKKCLKGENAA